MPKRMHLDRIKEYEIPLPEPVQAEIDEFEKEKGFAITNIIREYGNPGVVFRSKEEAIRDATHDAGIVWGFWKMNPIHPADERRTTKKELVRFFIRQYMRLAPE